MSARKIFVIFVHMFIGWFVCSAIMGISRQFIPIDTLLIIHLIAVPVVFSLISIVYFSKYNYTTPVVTALIFTSFIIVMDFLIWAVLLLKSMEMFQSILGTWIPFLLILLSTCITGLIITKRANSNK